MRKHAQASENVVRTSPHDGTTIVEFKQPGWRNECDAQDEGRRGVPICNWGNQGRIPTQPYKGESRVVDGWQKNLAR